MTNVAYWSLSTPNDIRSIFGPTVLEIVEQLTNDTSLPKIERKQKMIEKALWVGNAARIIKCCDRIDNVTDAVVSFTDQRVWDYVKESVLLHCNLRDGVDFGKPWFGEAVKAGKELKLAIDKVVHSCRHVRKIPAFDQFEAWRASKTT